MVTIGVQSWPLLEHPVEKGTSDDCACAVDTASETTTNAPIAARALAGDLEVMIYFSWRRLR